MNNQQDTQTIRTFFYRRINQISTFIHSSINPNRIFVKIFAKKTATPHNTNNINSSTHGISTTYNFTSKKNVKNTFIN